MFRARVTLISRKLRSTVNIFFSIDSVYQHCIILVDKIVLVRWNELSVWLLLFQDTSLKFVFFYIIRNICRIVNDRKRFNYSSDALNCTICWFELSWLHHRSIIISFSAKFSTKADFFALSIKIPSFKIHKQCIYWIVGILLEF